MKTCFVRSGRLVSNFGIVSVAVAFLALTELAPQLFAQGALTPPGAPAATMRTLEQVEPRIPISSLPFTISNGGSYYFTAHLTNTTAGNGLNINAQNVTVDLNGFSLVGLPISAFGISVSANLTNIVIRNGTITGCGGTGIAAGGARHGRAENLHITFNLGHGMQVGDSWMITRCQARANGNDGIIAGSFNQVLECYSANNGSDGIVLGGRSLIREARIGTNSGHGLVLSGIGSVIDSCNISGCAGDGISSASVAGSHRITRCSVENNFLSGIALASCCNMVTDNLIYGNGHDGIRLASRSMVARNHSNENGASTNTGAGIRVTSASRVEDNHMSGNDNGVATADNGNNVIIRNHAANNTTNYVLVGAQIAGPFIGVSGTITNVNPWANFSF